MSACLTAGEIGLICMIRSVCLSIDTSEGCNLAKLKSIEHEEHTSWTENLFCHNQNILCAGRSCVENWKVSAVWFWKCLTKNLRIW